MNLTRRARRAVFAASVSAVLAIAGCGSNSASPANTATSSASAAASSAGAAAPASSAAGPSAAASASPSQAGSSASTAPSAAGGTQAQCDAKQIGPIVRCENFYTAFWPTIQANMQKLYQQAKTTNGGNLSVWSWYPIPANEIAAFNKEFPDVHISTRGLNFNLASAIITAHATGGPSSDIVKGSITTMTQLYDQGFWDKINWASFGVPTQFLQIGGADTGLLANSNQGVSIQYNTNDVKSVPSQLQDFLDPQWHGKLVTTAFEGDYDFTGYGMVHGQAAMVDLIKKLRSSGNLTVSNNAADLLSSGDKAVYLDTDLTQNNPALKTAPIEDGQAFLQFIGVNKYSKNKPAAELFSLWQSFDPSWVAAVLHGALPGAVAPYGGLPTSTLSQATGVMKTNMDTFYQAIQQTHPIFETFKNRDQLNTLLAAAEKALS